MRNNFKQTNAFFAATLFISACAKSPVAIEKEKFTPQALAQRYAERVTQADPVEKGIATANLHEFDSKQMDWAFFWTLLSQRSGQAFTTGDLASLAQADCQAPAYGAFLSYAATKSYDLAALLVARPCPFPASNPILKSVVRRLNNETDANVALAVVSLAEQLRADFPAADFGVLESEISGEKWASIFKQVFATPSALRSLLISLGATSLKKIPFTAHLIDAEFKSHFIPSQPFEASTLLAWTYLLTLSEGLPVPHNQSQQADFFWQNYFTSWQKTWDSESTDVACTETCLQQSLEVISFTRKLLTRFPQLSFRWQLLWNERMQRAFEATLRKKGDVARGVLFQDKSVDAAWFLMRLNSLYALNPEARSQIAAPWASDENVDPLEQAVRFRVLVHTASDATQRFSFVQKFCNTLKDHGAGETDLDLAALPDTPLPGCYRTTFAVNPATAPATFSANRLVFPFDMVLRSYGADWTWNVKNVDAPIIDLSAYDRAPELGQEAPPESANALVLPLLVGLRIKGPVSESPDDLVFFPVHTVIREATSDLSAVHQPAQGRAGANFTLNATDAIFIPTFVSFGADGQTGAPPVPGGYGDESYLSVARIDREIFNWSGPQGEAVTFKSKLNFAELRELWLSAKQMGGLPLLQFSVEHTLQSLQAAQKAKLLHYCSTQGYDEAHLESCFLDRLIPKAESVVRKAVDNYQALSTEQQTTVGVEFNGEKAFALPGGAPGGINPNGPRGERGSFWLQIK